MRTVFILSLILLFAKNLFAQKTHKDTFMVIKIKGDPVFDYSEKNVTKIYNKKGYLVVSIPWKDGKRNGVAKEYYEDNEKLWQEIPYTNDTINGVLKRYYYRTGALASETTYNMGVIVSEKKWDKKGKLRK